MARNRPRRKFIAKPEIERERGQDFEIILRIPRILPVALVRNSGDKVRASALGHGSQQEARIANRLHSKSAAGIAAPVIANAIEGGHGFIEGERAARIVSADGVRGNIHHVIDIGAELEGVASFDPGEVIRQPRWYC